MQRKQEAELEAETKFSEIVKRAYNLGMNDDRITVTKLLEEIITDLRKMKVI